MQVRPSAPNRGKQIVALAYWPDIQVHSLWQHARQALPDSIQHVLIISGLIQDQHQHQRKLSIVPEPKCWINAL